MPWPPRTAMAVLILLGLVWLAGFGFLATGRLLLGGLTGGVAAWLSVGLIYTVLRTPERNVS